MRHRGESMAIDLSILMNLTTSCALFKSHVNRCDQVSINSRSIDKPNALFVALPGSRTDGHRFLLDAENRGARYALIDASFQIKSPFKRLLTIPVSNPLMALQSLARHHRRAHRAKVIGITGSSGKTHCKDLLHHLLKTSLNTRCSAESDNSQIGVALSLLKIRPLDEVAIIECGVSLPGEMQMLADLVQPDFAILTTIEDKHRETLGSATSICLEKSQLLRAVSKRGWCLLPQRAVDILTQSGIPIPAHWRIWDQQLSKTRKTIKSDRCAENRSDDARADLSSPLLTSCEMNQLSCQAALHFGICENLIAKRRLSFRVDLMRLEMWRPFAGFTIINDLYCADVASLGKTLDWAQLFARKGGKKILWFGGVRGRPAQKTSRALQQQIEKFGIDEVVLGDPLATKRVDQNLKGLCSLLNMGDLLIVRGAKKINHDTLARRIGVPLPPAILEIDLTAIAHNVRLLRSSLPSKVTFMAMLKACAYGTDAQIMARFLTRCGLDYFGLATVEEAIALREAGIEGQLLVLHAAESQWDLAARYDLQICVSQKREIQGLAKSAVRAKKALKLHLHIDIGMCRLGCAPAKSLALAKFICEHPLLELEGVMGHFASADVPGQIDFTKKQREIFEKIIQSLKRAHFEPRHAHLANSAAALKMNPDSCTLIRIGLALFGLTPPESNGDLMLKPALSLNAKIAHLHTIKRGQSVSYGRKYTATREKERIAVIPLGYADGFQRQYGSASVMIKGQKAPLVGTICMDFTMCDVTQIQGVRIGDTAQVFGHEGLSNRPAHHLAAELNVSTHELIASLGPRIQRLFSYDQKPVFP